MPHTYTQNLLWPDRILCTSPAVRKEKNYALVAVSQGCWLCHCSTQSSDTSEVAAQLPPGTAGPGQERSGCAESGDAAHPALNSRTGNGHDKHPDQTPQCGYRQTDLFARSGHWMQQISRSTWSTRRAGKPAADPRLCLSPSKVLIQMGICELSIKEQRQSLSTWGRAEGWI